MIYPYVETPVFLVLIQPLVMLCVIFTAYLPLVVIHLDVIVPALLHVSVAAHFNLSKYLPYPSPHHLQFSPMLPSSYMA